MTICPILLDSQPSYLQRSSRPVTLLTAPLGASTLAGYLSEAVRPVTTAPPLVLTGFQPTEEYRRLLRRLLPRVEGPLPASVFRGALSSYEPSDWLLILDPRCLPAAGLDLATFVHGLLERPSGVRQLVALGTTLAGTQEQVQLGAEGRVVRIQRYFEDVTWPFASGVACILLSAAALSVLPHLRFSSLGELREDLARCGVPSRDMALRGGVFDLEEEADYLVLNELSVLGNRTPEASPQIAPGARVFGPVTLQPGSHVEAGAVVIGPAVLGEDAVVRSGAVVAQSVVLPGASVAGGLRFSHRVVGEGTPEPDEDDGALALRADRSDEALRGWPGVPAVADTARPGQRYLAIREVVEPILVAIMTLPLVPFLALVALLIKLDSRGPVLYGDRREGKGGRSFRCWKFRTMVPDAASKQRALETANLADGPQFKIERDPRVTRIGRRLRATNIDELPQLINVVVGQMSLVGPRPSPFRENQVCVPWREARLSVRPGITGLWQICRRDRSEGDFHQWVHYDLLYVRNASLWLDLKILLATVFSLGGRKNVPIEWMLPRGATGGDGRMAREAQSVGGTH